ncbi:hypothetical protein RUM43_005023 [Polyplax serrata]|uniref:HAUS augmin-like complex subunit 3 N-terminal domain-containing protein n=1 Tax=Polyplax serrata TaxID=468196 RepID=A0AAN8SBG3_POLSC
MALTVQNKSFLAHLHKLDIDLGQFPEKSFDGLFDNIPESLSYFFNWFLENVNSDNVLSKWEEAEYFELEKNNCLPDNEEVNYILSTCQPTYDELKTLDTNYIKTLLPQDFEELRLNHERLDTIYEDIVVNHDDVKKRQNEAKEKINMCKKQLDLFKENCKKTNFHISEKLSNIVQLLIEPQDMEINVDLYNNFVRSEEAVIQNINNCFFLFSKAIPSNKIHLLHKVKENLINAEVILLFSRGLLQAKQVKIEVLKEFLKSTNIEKRAIELCSLDQVALNSSDTEAISVRTKDIGILEEELNKEVKGLCYFDVLKIEDNYYLNKADLNNATLELLKTCKNYVKSNSLNNECLLLILGESVTSIEAIKSKRKQCLTKLKKCETKCHNNAKNFELKKQRFREITNKPENHPFQVALKSVFNDNFEKAEHQISLENLFTLTSNICEASNFAMHKYKNIIQLKVKTLINDVLCGPTNQVLHIPVDLLLRSQKCEKNDRELSHEIKRLLNKYLETKELVAKSDRRGLLLWIDFLTNPGVLHKIFREHNCSAAEKQ